MKTKFIAYINHTEGLIKKLHMKTRTQLNLVSKPELKPQLFIDKKVHRLIILPSLGRLQNGNERNI